MDTIFATATGRPPAALAIVRISGPAAVATARDIAGVLPPARQAGLRTLRDAQGDILDQSVVLTFPGPNSFTGEDVVELHCHGGRAVIKAVERTLAALPQLRPARPGEFTRRALANGRMDLAEAEGLADLLEAETEDQRRAALTAVEGRVSSLVRGWVDALRQMRAAVEAELNFADEVESTAHLDLIAPIHELRTAMVTALAAPSVERIKTGISVVLAGPPNAGKSTLFNLLCGRDAAIVSPMAGTTRDRIEAPVRREGAAYVLIDTAGLNDTACEIEAAGVRLAYDAMQTADIVLWLGEEPPSNTAAIWVQSKGDIGGRAGLMTGRDIVVARSDQHSIDALWTQIARQAVEIVPTSDPIVLRESQRQRVSRAIELLHTGDSDPILMAENLRQADFTLSGILGYGATEEMLDVLFGRFCIGK